MRHREGENHKVSQRKSEVTSMFGILIGLISWMFTKLDQNEHFKCMQCVEYQYQLCENNSGELLVYSLSLGLTR